MITRSRHVLTVSCSLLSDRPEQLQVGVSAFGLRRKYPGGVGIHACKRNFTFIQHGLKSLALTGSDPEPFHCSAGCLDQCNILGIRDFMPASDSIPRGGRVVVEVPSHCESPEVEKRILAREVSA